MLWCFYKCVENGRRRRRGREGTVTYYHHYYDCYYILVNLSFPLIFTTNTIIKGRYVCRLFSNLARLFIHFVCLFVLSIIFGCLIAYPVVGYIIERNNWTLGRWEFYFCSRVYPLGYTPVIRLT